MRFLLFLLIFVLFSCQNSENVTVIKSDIYTSTESENMHSLEDESLEYFYYPNDSVFDLNIYYKDSYHIEDFDLQSFMKKPNLGLFKNESGFYVSNFSYKVKRFNHWFDEVNGVENQQNGLKIDILEPKDSCHFMISGLQAKFENKIQKIENVVSPTYIHPKKPFEFKLSGNYYKLFATASNVHDYEENGYFTALNYKLYIEDKSQKIIQLLAASPNFDDAVFQILFIGDLDNDGIPDLIADTSPKYSYGQLTLYLSGRSNWQNVYKIAAMNHVSGC